MDLLARLVVLIALAYPVARAGDEVQARVLRIDGEDLYASLGVEDGVRDQQEVIVYRVVEVPAGARGDTLSDLFYLGTARVIEAGDHLSRVRASPELARQIKIGDVVRVEPLVRERPPEPLPAPPPTPTPTPAPSRSTAAELEATIADLSQRLADCQAAPAPEACPQLPAQPVIPPEAPDQPEPVAQETPDEPEPLELIATAQRAATPGEPVRIHLTARQPQRVQAALLIYRRAEEEVYRFVDMRPHGDTAWVAVIPADAVVPPGVDWYIAVRDEGGHEHRASLPGGAPNLDVPSPRERAAAGATSSELTLSCDFRDFYYLKGVDRVQVAQVDYL